MTLEIPIIIVSLSQSDWILSLEDKTERTKIQLAARIRVIFEEYKYFALAPNWPRQIIFKKKFVKVQMKNIQLSCLHFTNLSGNWVNLGRSSRWLSLAGLPCLQTVRWRFIYLNGKLHQGTTKPFILPFTQGYLLLRACFTETFK